ncbi:hypothetical protein Tcan_01133, partial [Toxocara canis]
MKSVLELSGCLVNHDRFRLTWPHCGCGDFVTHFHFIMPPLFANTCPSLLTALLCLSSICLPRLLVAFQASCGSNFSVLCSIATPKYCQFTVPELVSRSFPNALRL